MIFLIEYKPSEGKIIEIKAYPDTERLDAEDDRLKKELTFISGKLDNEVILLEADSESDLYLTHNRYFHDIRGIASS